MFYYYNKLRIIKSEFLFYAPRLLFSANTEDRPSIRLTSHILRLTFVVLTPYSLTLNSTLCAHRSMLLTIAEVRQIKNVF